MKKFVFIYTLMINNLLIGQIILTKSNLPIVLINTNGKTIMDEPKIAADMGIINNPNGENSVSDQPNDYQGKIGIEFRGSTSQAFPKKPYGFETQDTKGESIDNNSLLGMPKESDWTMNASYNDKSLIRDGLAYILGGSFMEYAPRVRYTELVVNQQYQGVYLLIEKIKRDKNRVNIEKMEAKDIIGDQRTGGYIIKMDKETGSGLSQGWSSKFPNRVNGWQKTFFQIDYPKSDDLVAVQFNYIKSLIDEIDDVMMSSQYKDQSNGFRKYIDTSSLMDFIILNELTKNPDAYRLSTYFYKDRDSKNGKIKFGPIWDFNLGFGNVDYCTQGNPEGLVITNFNQVCPDDYWITHFWWQKFIQDKSFYHSLKSRWKDLRTNQLSNEIIQHTVDSIALMLQQPQLRNFGKWDILGEYIWPNYYVGTTYGQELDYLKSWLDKRLAWLDKEWEIEEIDGSPKYYLATPNPTTGKVMVTLKEKVLTNPDVVIYNTIGQKLISSYQVIDEYNIEFDVSNLANSLYFIQLNNGTKKYCFKIVKN